MPVRLATSSYSGSARLSGALADVTNAVVTTCGICGAYRLALARLVSARLVSAGLAPARRGATRAAGRPECGARACAAAAACPDLVRVGLAGAVLVRVGLAGAVLAGPDS